MWTDCVHCWRGFFFPQLNHAIAGKNELFENVNIDWDLIHDEHLYDIYDYSDDDLDGSSVSLFPLIICTKCVSHLTIWKNSDVYPRLICAYSPHRPQIVKIGLGPAAWFCHRRWSRSQVCPPGSALTPLKVSSRYPCCYLLHHQPTANQTKKV